MPSDNPIKDFFSFDRSTRNGYIVLLSLLFLLLSIRIILQYRPLPEGLPLDESIQKEWINFKTDIETEKQNFQESKKTFSTDLQPQTFDPNTVDSTQLIAIGLPARTVKYFINWRNKGKVFRHKEDFKEVYSLQPEHYEQLEAYIRIDQSRLKSFSRKNEFSHTKRTAPSKIEINTTDVATLELLYGVGNFTAQKIIDRRNELGGYVYFQQIKEAWKFPDSVLLILEKTLVFNSEKIKRIKINTVTVEDLAKHPYIKEKLAKNILLYRDGIKLFTDVQQLKQVPLMDEEKYRKIAPYISLD